MVTMFNGDLSKSILQGRIKHGWRFVHIDEVHEMLFKGINVCIGPQQHIYHTRINMISDLYTYQVLVRIVITSGSSIPPGVGY